MEEIRYCEVSTGITNYIRKVFKCIAPDLQNKAGVRVMYHTDSVGH